MTNPTALGALQKRVKDLTGSMHYSMRERDRYQAIVDQQQQFVDNAQAEIASINAAIELLEAAATYQGEHQP